MLNGLKLTEVLLIPNFTHNFLLVNKLTLANLVSCFFFPNFCLVQDQKSKKVLAVGRVVGHLYFLDNSSFAHDVLQHFHKSELLQQCCDDNSLCLSVSSTYLNNVVLHNDIFLWHSRLGHPSDLVQQHLPFSFTSKT